MTSDHALFGGTHLGWQSIPGSPLEAGVFLEDRYPIIRLRWNQEVARDWFKGMVVDNVDWIRFHLDPERDG